MSTELTTIEAVRMAREFADCGRPLEAQALLDEFAIDVAHVRRTARVASPLLDRELTFDPDDDIGAHVRELRDRVERLHRSRDWSAARRGMASATLASVASIYKSVYSDRAVDDILMRQRLPISFVDTRSLPLPSIEYVSQSTYAGLQRRFAPRSRPGGELSRVLFEALS